MKRINKAAAGFLLALGMVCSSLADDIFTVYEYPAFDFDDGQFIAGKVDFTPVGTVSIWTQNEIPKSWLECNGQTVDPVKYPELRKLMATVPDYRGRFLQGLETGKNVGDRLEAGLPNITGSFYGTSKNGAYMVNRHIGIGAFEDTYNIKSFNIYAQTNTAPISWSSPVVFNAARSNATYGKSTTVQPPAVVVKYIIKAE